MYYQFMFLVFLADKCASSYKFSFKTRRPQIKQCKVPILLHSKSFINSLVLPKDYLEYFFPLIGL